MNLKPYINRRVRPRKTVKVAIANQKGGVGKTTTATHLAIGLAALGYEVAILDMDSQGHVSVALDILFPTFDRSGKPKLDELGQPILTPFDGVYEYMVNNAALDEVMFEVSIDQYVGLVPTAPQGKLWLLPGYLRTATAAVDMQIKGFDYRALGRELAPLDEIVDFVIVDTSPTVALFTPAIIAMADYVLVPTLLERLSGDGIQQIAQILVNLEGLHSAEILGVLPIMTRMATREHQSQLDNLNDAYGDLVWGEFGIPQSTIWPESSDVAQTVFRYAPDHPAAESGWRFVSHVLDKLGVGDA